MTMRSDARRLMQGVALIELIVAMVVLAIGIIGIGKGMTSAIAARGSAHEYTMGTMLAQSKLAELEAAIEQDLINWQAGAGKVAPAGTAAAIPPISMSNSGSEETMRGRSFKWNTTAEMLQEPTTVSLGTSNAVLVAQKYLCKCTAKVTWMRAGAENNVTLYSFVPIGVVFEEKGS